MALIGHIKEIQVSPENQIEAIVMTGNGQELTATVFASSGSEFFPVRGDVALCHEAGSEIVISAILHGDASTLSGEGTIFARDAAGNVTGSIHLAVDGTITMTPGITVNVGTASDFVAMAAKVDALWATLWGMFTAWAPQATDGGAALKTQFQTAFPSSPSSVASTNLKAD